MNPKTEEERWRLRYIYLAWLTGYRLATAEEVQYADPWDIHQHTVKGSFCGPHFVKQGYNGIF